MPTNNDSLNQSGGGMNRREFLGKSVTGAAAMMAGPAILRGQNLNEKLDVAVIGAGGRGAHDTAKVANAGANIVALCDVSEKRLDVQGKQYPKAKKFIDFRKVYEHEKDFDAVIVATPEHTHAFATLPALQLKKHVYCEKPLTHNVWEARLIRKAAREANVVTQQGTQLHASDNYRRVVELIANNAVGPVREVHVWVSRAWGWHSSKEAAEEANDRFIIIDSPTGSMPKPDGLHWDLWIGPAQMRPFHKDYYPGPKWYRFWDFGNGTMSDLGSHRNDLPFWALKLTAPRTVEAFGPPPHPDLAPASMHVMYEFPQRGDMPPVTMTWYQGEHKPEIWKRGDIPQWGNGCLFIGDKGMLLADYRKHVLLPEKDFKDFEAPAPYLPRPEGHHAEWVKACKTEGRASADFEYAGLLTEANHLGNVAFRTGKKLQWDPVNLRAVNAPEAYRYIRRAYRKGWEFPSSVAIADEAMGEEG